MEKKDAISILEDIKESLNKKNWQEESLKTIKIYEKGLKVATNEEIQKLIEKQKLYIEKYGENDERTLHLNKKIDRKLRKIYNN